MRTSSKTLVRRNYLRRPAGVPSNPAEEQVEGSGPLGAVVRAAFSTALVVGLGIGVLALFGNRESSALVQTVWPWWVWLTDALQSIAAVHGVSCAPVSVGELAASQARMLEGLIGMAAGPLGRAMGLASLLMGGALAVAKNSPVPAVMGVLNALMLTVVPSIMAGMMGCIVS